MEHRLQHKMGELTRTPIKVEQRLRQWRPHWREPLASYSLDDDGGCHCLNCGRDFVGNYCPRCGQPAATGRFTWKSMMTGLLDVWDLAGRSVPSTLLQLAYRPGYLLRDYLSGRRQSYFPPIKLLLFVAVMVAMFEYWVPPRQKDRQETETTVVSTPDEEYSKAEKDVNHYMEAVFAWGEENAGWGALLCCSFLILPTCWLFRRSPSYPHITVPESFFMQAYLCSILLTCSFLSGYIRGFILMYFPIMYLAYRQLFGYGWWGTMWRVVLLLVFALCSFGLLLVIVGELYAIFLVATGQMDISEV